jgi:dihydrofolate reductase
MLINGIVAMDKNKGIGIDNKLPWVLPADLLRFQKLTTGNRNNAIIVGKNTWNSIKFLKGRDHLILSTSLSMEYVQDERLVKTFSDINILLNFIQGRRYDQVWVIGGHQIYKKFLELNLLNELHITLIDEAFNCDTFFPTIPETYFLTKKQIVNEKTANGKDTYMTVLKRIEKGMRVMYKHNIYTVVGIHCDVYPKYYFTLVDGDGREIQTIKSNLQLKL